VKRYFLSIGLIAGLAVAVSVQSEGAVTHRARMQATAPADYPCQNAQFLSDQQQFVSGQTSDDQFVDVCGKVTKVLASKHTRSGNHGYFYIQVADGVTIEIVSDLDQMKAPAWPFVQVGDMVYVQGRYYYDSASSQGIDWTHHGTSRSWPHAGYVVVNGTKYQ